MGFPRPPLKGIDWASLGFDPLEGIVTLQMKARLSRYLLSVNGHIESRYTKETKEWSEPVFVKDPFIRIHGLAPALNYGQQAFEGMKGRYDILIRGSIANKDTSCLLIESHALAFRNPEGQIQLFRPAMNAARMSHSVGFVAIPEIPEGHFLRCVHLAIGLNSEYVPPHETDASFYCRPLAFASSATLGLKLAFEYTFCVYVLPVAPLHGAKSVDALVLENFDRAAPLGTGSAKVGGNYGPVLGLIDDANRKGYGITLHLDSKSHTDIDEFSTSAFIGVKTEGNEHTVVVSDSSQIVQSITCDSVCEIARSFGWKVERRTIPFEEVQSFSEVFGAGTAAVLIPVRSIKRESTGEVLSFLEGSEEPGSCYARLYSTLKSIQQGKMEDKFGWVDVVQEPDETWHAIVSS